MKSSHPKGNESTSERVPKAEAVSVTECLACPRWFRTQSARKTSDISVIRIITIYSEVLEGIFRANLADILVWISASRNKGPINSPMNLVSPGSTYNHAQHHVNCRYGVITNPRLN